MATKIYDGSTTKQLLFDASYGTENILKVSNFTGFSEYRNGKDLIIFSSNGTDYLTVVGAYSNSSRLDYIEYYDANGEVVSKRLVSTIDEVPTSGNHFFAGTSQDDVINGGQANSVSATGYSGNDQISGSGGQDYLAGNDGNDTIAGSGGNDILLGNAGKDLLEGGSGGDWLFGGTGIDTIFGGNGNDILNDGAGTDYLYGGAGKDTLSGGSDNDTFTFKAVSESSKTATSTDLITDFVIGQDKISLSGIDAFASSGPNDAFIWKGIDAFGSTTKGEVRYQKFDKPGTANDHTMVWIDNDADTDVEMAIRLMGLYNLTAGDFIL